MQSVLVTSKAQNKPQQKKGRGVTILNRKGMRFSQENRNTLYRYDYSRT